jgi:hypothetical protein
LTLIPLARDARGRFARGHSGNPRGRPRGIRNPRLRVPDLRARPLRPQALSALLDKKPWLLYPLARQVLPPPAAAIDPLERLGIDIASLDKPEDFRGALSTLFAALARGDLSAGEIRRIARRLRGRMRLVRRLAPPRQRLRLTAGGKPR